MKLLRWFWIWVAVLITGLVLVGCCDNPEVLAKIQQSMNSIQQYYDPLVDELLNDQQNATKRKAVVAADTTLALAGALQAQWCPTPGMAEQLALQATQAKQLAAPLIKP